MPVSFVGFAVGLQAIVQLAQAIPNNGMADLVIHAFQFLAQLPQAERRPQLPPHRITSRHRFNQRLEVAKQGWVLRYPRLPPATPSAYPLTRSRGAVVQIFEPPVYGPSRQTRRLSRRAHTTMSNHPCFRRRPAPSAPLIQQRSHSLPTFPKSSDVRSFYHPTILSPPMLFGESPNRNS